MSQGTYLTRNLVKQCRLIHSFEIFDCIEVLEVADALHTIRRPPTDIEVNPNP